MNNWVGYGQGLQGSGGGQGGQVPMGHGQAGGVGMYGRTPARPQQQSQWGTAGNQFAMLLQWLINKAMTDQRVAPALEYFNRAQALELSLPDLLHVMKNFGISMPPQLNEATVYQDYKRYVDYQSLKLVANTTAQRANMAANRTGVMGRTGGANMYASAQQQQQQQQQNYDYDSYDTDGLQEVTNNVSYLGTRTPLQSALLQQQQGTTGQFPTTPSPAASREPQLAAQLRQQQILQQQQQLMAQRSGASAAQLMAAQQGTPFQSRVPTPSLQQQQQQRQMATQQRQTQDLLTPQPAHPFGAVQTPRQPPPRTTTPTPTPQQQAPMHPSPQLSQQRAHSPYPSTPAAPAFAQAGMGNVGAVKTESPQYSQPCTPAAHQTVVPPSPHMQPPDTPAAPHPGTPGAGPANADVKPVVAKPKPPRKRPAKAVTVGQGNGSVPGTPAAVVVVEEVQAEANPIPPMAELTATKNQLNQEKEQIMLRDQDIRLQFTALNEQLMMLPEGGPDRVVVAQKIEELKAEHAGISKRYENVIRQLRTVDEQIRVAVAEKKNASRPRPKPKKEPQTPATSQMTPAATPGPTPVAAAGKRPAEDATPAQPSRKKPKDDTKPRPTPQSKSTTSAAPNKAGGAPEASMETEAEVEGWQRFSASDADAMMRGDLEEEVCHGMFLHYPALKYRMAELGRKYGVKGISAEACLRLSEGIQEKMAALLGQVAVISDHRYDDKYEELKMRKQGGLGARITRDTRSQIKFFERIDKEAHRRKEEEEKEKLMRAAKSRSKFADQDPNLSMLRQRAKEVRAEEEQIRTHQAANDTALLAIGAIGRKKKPPMRTPKAPTTPGSPGNANNNPSTPQSASVPVPMGLTPSSNNLAPTPMNPGTPVGGTNLMVATAPAHSIIPQPGQGPPVPNMGVFATIVGLNRWQRPTQARKIVLQDVYVVLERNQTVKKSKMMVKCLASKERV